MVFSKIRDSKKDASFTGDAIKHIHLWLLVIECGNGI